MSALQAIVHRSGRYWRALARCRRGVAVTELALTLPFLLGVGLMGLEVANRAVVQMKVSQLAIHVADHASRIGEQSTLENRRVYESDLNDLLYGADMQASGLDLLKHGRIIISSLEVVPGTDEQNFIHWQRCKGKKVHQSSYGEEGDGELSGIPGMGPPGEEVFAFDDEAVMFVEVAYDYQPLVGQTFGLASVMTARASFTVRANRDLSQVYQRDAANPDPVARCNRFDD